jgi:hypothetical protein
MDRAYAAPWRDRSGTGMKLLFFSPYAFINLHCYPEAVVAENLRRRGHEIVQVHCRGAYSQFCIAMSAIQLRPGSPEEEKAAVCSECQVKRRSLERQFAFQSVFIDDHLTPEMRAATELALGQVTVDNWTQLEYAGVPVPRYASYEYILNEKIESTRIDPALWDGFRVHVRNAFYTLHAGRALLEAVKPDAILAYNTNYSCNHILCKLGEQRGIPNYSLHAGAHHKHRLSEMTIFKGFVANSLVNRSNAWRRYAQRALSERSVARAKEHVDELIEAKSDWVYTLKSENRAPADLRKLFGVGDGQKVLLATMASGDERFAANLIDALPEYKTPMFATQIDWIHNLIEWARRRRDVFLIIRVHPREFPNKREAVLSQYAQRLQALFVDLPENARVNWPKDQLSLHDIVKIVDVGLNATSTAGLELLLFGVPVLIYDLDQFFSYPPELNICASSAQDYFSQIDAALSEGRSIDHVVAAFRWIAFKSDMVAIDISDAYSLEHINKPQSIWVKIERRVLRWLDGRKSAPFEDALVNWKGFRKPRNAEWLAYAVEHGAESHIEERVARLLDTPPECATKERQAILRAMHAYFDRLGMPRLS